MRKQTALLLSLMLALNLTSCTSNDSKDDESMGDEAVAEETSGTDGDLENLEAAPADQAVANSGNEGFLDEQLPEDALGESTQTAQSGAPADAPPADLNLDDPSAASSSVADQPTGDIAPTDAMGDTSAPPPTTETPLSDNSVAAIDPGTSALPPDDTSTSSPDMSSIGSTESAPVAEAKPKASLKKVEASPLTRKGVLLNAVYVARSGDNYKKISQMIYGDASKQKELKKVNPSISKPKVGDKIYYNSPVRPTDDTKMLTFYEDAGMVPEVYVAKEGDTIKSVAKETLGSESNWKELWVTNPIESKGTLEAGTEIRYWKSAPPPATAPVTPPTDVAMAPPPPMEEAAPPMPDLPPPPPPDMGGQQVAGNEMPPPPPTEMAPPPPPPSMEVSPPPPPPADAVNPPPPPAMPKKTLKDPGMLAEGGMDPDMMMTLAAAGILAAGVAAILIMKKRRQNRDMASAFNDTQVGT